MGDQQTLANRRFSRRVSEGTRTPDRLDHNQELYQLSYAHRGTWESTSASRQAGRAAARAPDEARVSPLGSVVSLVLAR
jgi:hypothetical protein